MKITIEKTVEIQREDVQCLIEGLLERTSNADYFADKSVEHGLNHYVDYDDEFTFYELSDSEQEHPLVITVEEACENFEEGFIDFVANKSSMVNKFSQSLEGMLELNPEDWTDGDIDMFLQVCFFGVDPYEIG